MRMFSIREIEQLTGIKTHTVRIWEQRYQFLIPQRDESNLRTYTLPQLEQLMDIALLLRNGYRISFLASLDVTSLKERLLRLQMADDRMELAVNALLVKMYHLDADGFEATLRDAAEEFDAPGLVNQVLVPFLERSSLFWSGKRLTEEHFVVTSVRKHLIRSIAHLPLPSAQAPAALLFIQDVRQLDLALLVTQFKLLHSGVRVLYMGTDISYENLQMAWQRFRPQYFYTYVSSRQMKTLQSLAAFHQKAIPDARILVTVFPGEDQRTLVPGIQLVTYAQALDIMTDAQRFPEEQPDSASLQTVV